MPGLLVAAMVGLHENNKVKLEQTDHIFKVCVCGSFKTQNIISHNTPSLFPLGLLRDIKMGVGNMYECRIFYFIKNTFNF